MNGGCSLLYPKQFQMSCGFSFGQLVQALDHHSHGRLPLLNSTSMPHPTQIIATLHLPPKLLFFIYCITYGHSMRLLLHIWLASKLLHFLHSPTTLTEILENYLIYFIDFLYFLIGQSWHFFGRKNQVWVWFPYENLAIMKEKWNYFYFSTFLKACFLY